MVGGWLLKVVLGIALVGFLVIEGGSPLIAQAQADDAVQEIAVEAAFQFSRTTTVEGMQQRCEELAAKKDVTIENCGFDEAGNISVTVTKQARSVLLKNLSPTKDWYVRRASATSPPR